MKFETFCLIDEIVSWYTGAYALNGDTLMAHLDDESKEKLLNDLDMKRIKFSHTYENGRLEVTFTE